MGSKRTISKGTCALCGASFSKAAMSRHLTTCLARRPASGGGKGVHIMVEGADDPRYWMHLAVRATAPLGDLDGFLRAAWLECCDHLSEFRVSRRGDEMDMAGQVGALLRPGMTLIHEYDFGTTTTLTVRVLDEMAQMPKGERIQLLALNDPPQHLCAVCGKPAEVVDTEEGEPFCAPCAAEHGDEEMQLPLVNSPRAGVCGYTGPAIRVETMPAVGRADR